MTGVFLLVLIAGNIYVTVKRKEEIRASGTPFGKSSLKGWIIGLSIADLIVVALIDILLCFPVQKRFSRICLFVMSFLFLLWLIGTMVQWWNEKRLALWGVLFLISVVLFTCITFFHFGEWLVYEPAYSEYEPFQKNSKVARLEEEATLRFSDGDDLPRMAGDVELYPVYAAIARATYPESLGQKDAEEIEQIVSYPMNSYEELTNGECDVIFVTEIDEEQRAKAEEMGVELVYTPICRDAFVFFVHHDNPIAGMTLDEIRGIYSGKITQWEQLNSPLRGTILAYQCLESESNELLKDLVMGDIPLMAPSKELYDGNVGPYIPSYKNKRKAMGCAFRFYGTEMIDPLDIRLLAIDGVEPTTEDIENGTYPLISDFYAVTRSDADENTRALVDWICSPQGQALVEKTGYTKRSAEE